MASPAIVFLDASSNLVVCFVCKIDQTLSVEAVSVPQYFIACDLRLSWIPCSGTFLWGDAKSVRHGDGPPMNKDASPYTKHSFKLRHSPSSVNWERRDGGGDELAY